MPKQRLFLGRAWYGFSNIGPSDCECFPAALRNENLTGVFVQLADTVERSNSLTNKLFNVKSNSGDAKKFERGVLNLSFQPGRNPLSFPSLSVSYI